MRSRLKSIFRKLFALSFALSFVALSKSLAQDQSPVTMTSSKYYTHSFGPNGNIHTPKSGTGNFVYSKSGYFIYVSSKNSKISFAVEYSHKGRLYSLFVSTGGKVGVLTEMKKTMFNMDSFACGLQNHPSSEVISDESLADSINEIAYSNSVLDESCQKKSKLTQKLLLKSLSSELDPQSSLISKCLNSDYTQTILNKDFRLRTLGTKIVSSFQDEFGKQLIGTTKLKFSCLPSEKASYDPKKPAINIPIKGNLLVNDSCKNRAQVIAHELFHHAGLDEQEASEFDQICARSQNVESLTKLECKKVYSQENSSASPIATEGPRVLENLEKAKKQENKTQQAAMTTILREEINTAEFIPVQDADIQELAKPSSPENFNRSLNRVSTAMSTNLEKMAGPLNKAIAATVTPAGAVIAESSTTKSRTTSATKRSPANTKANKNKEYVVEEILADKYDIPVEKVRAMSAQIDSKSSTTRPDIAATAKQNSATTNKATARKTAAASEIAGTNATPGSGANLGSSYSSTPSNANSSSSARRGPSSVRPASGNFQPAPNVEKTAQELRYFNEVRGDRYRKVQQLYDDKSFSDELKSQSIAIEYRKNNQLRTIGDTSREREKLFSDDGTALKQKK